MAITGSRALMVMIGGVFFAVWSQPLNVKASNAKQDSRAIFIKDAEK
jgi:glucose uptake protein GlcU